MAGTNVRMLAPIAPRDSGPQLAVVEPPINKFKRKRSKREFRTYFDADAWRIIGLHIKVFEREVLTNYHFEHVRKDGIERISEGKLVNKCGVMGSIRLSSVEMLRWCKTSLLRKVKRSHRLYW